MTLRTQPPSDLCFFLIFSRTNPTDGTVVGLLSVCFVPFLPMFLSHRQQQQQQQSALKKSALPSPEIQSSVLMLSRLLDG